MVAGSGAGVDRAGLVVGELAVGSLLGAVRGANGDGDESRPGGRATDLRAVAEVLVRLCVRLGGVEGGGEQVDLVGAEAEGLADDVEGAELRIPDHDGVAGDRERPGTRQVGVVGEGGEGRKGFGRPGGAAVGGVGEAAAVVEVPVVPGGGEDVARGVHAEGLLIAGELAVRDVDDRADGRRRGRDRHRPQREDRGKREEPLSHSIHLPSRPAFLPRAHTGAVLAS